MSDVRTELERLAERIQPSATAFDRLERHRRRRARNRRIGTAVVASSLAVAVSGGVIIASNRVGPRGHRVASVLDDPFTPIWPESTFTAAHTAQEAYAAGSVAVPSWRGDAAETAMRFARSALGWDADWIEGDHDPSAEGAEFALGTAAVPCPSPADGGAMSPACSPGSIVVDLRQVEPGGIWSVVTVRGSRITDASFAHDPNGNATRVDVTTTGVDDHVLTYLAVTGVGACRGWESDSFTLGAPPTQPPASAPADHPEGCDVVVVVLALPAGSPSPRGLGQAVLFGDGPSATILDALAAPAHVGASDAAVAPPEDRLEIRCDGDIRVPTDTVVAGPSGVDIVAVDEILDTPATLEIAPARPATTPVATYELAPSEPVSLRPTLAPGRYVATCGYPDTPGGEAHTVGVSFAVTDPGANFVDVSLGCADGDTYEVTPAPDLEAPDRNGDPLELVQAHLSGLRDGDSLARAGGYRENVPTVVSVTRNGRVAGSVAFFEDSGGGFLVDTIRGCSGTSFAWDRAAHAPDATGPSGDAGGATGAAPADRVAVLACEQTDATDLAATIRTVPADVFPAYVAPCELAAPAREPFSLSFTNADPGVERNLSVYPMTPCLEIALGGDDIGCDPGDPAFSFDVVAGGDPPVQTVSSPITLAAGRYWLQDDVHPNQVHGLLVVR